MVDSIRYLEWYTAAEKNLKSAEILLQHDGDYGIVAFHCQQAIEKMMKGFLLNKSSKLEKGHSLVMLNKKAQEYDEIFSEYMKDCTYVNQFYIETRYPADESLNLKAQEVEECIRMTKCIISHIDKQKISF